MKKVGVFQFVSGFVLGALIFGGSMVIAAGIIAQPKTANVVIDGKTVDLKGYIIEDSHYFQLRDLSAALAPGGKDFSIVWDSQHNRIIINSQRSYEPDETLPSHNTDLKPTVLDFDEMKEEVIRLTNTERVKVGLPELIILPELMDCAQLKAEDMIENHYYGHASPVYGSANDMVSALVPGYRGVCENLNLGGTYPADVIAGWMESTEHSKNLLDSRVTHIGIGIAEQNSGTWIWVQQLMRK